MPTFRNRTTGQVVTVEDDPSHLSGLARWEPIEEYHAPAVDPDQPFVAYTDTSKIGLDPAFGPPVPFGDTAEPVSDPVAEPVTEQSEDTDTAVSDQVNEVSADVSAAADHAAAAAADLEVSREAAAEQIAELNAELALPGPDAERADWVAYAKAHGKTDADLKGKKVDTIRSWFVADDE